MLTIDSLLLGFKFEFNLDRFHNINAIVIIGYNYDICQNNNNNNNKFVKEIEMCSMPKLELSYRPRILSLSNLTPYFEDV